MKGSTVSRRVSEFVGVALFAAALIWVIALASYNPTDPAWFFSAGLTHAPENFAGRVGAFLAELSFQLAGYAAYAIPAFLVMVGWHYFWCREVDAAASKMTGAALLFASHQCVSRPGRRHHRRRRQAVSRRRLRRRVAGRRAVGISQPHRLGHRHPDAGVSRRHHFDAVLHRPHLVFGVWRRPRQPAPRPRRLPRLAGRSAARAAAPGSDRQAHQKRDARARDQGAEARSPLDRSRVAGQARRARWRRRGRAAPPARRHRNRCRRPGRRRSACRRRRCRCPTPSRSRARPSAARASTTCRRPRCSIRPRPSARSTSVS